MEEESYEDVIDAYESGVGVEEGESLTDYIKRNNIKIKQIQTEDLTGSRPMEEQGIMQASTRTIDPTVTMEEVVIEFIKEKGRKPNSIDELKEFYFEKMGATENVNPSMASAYTDDELQMYEQYKYDMNEQRPGMPIMEIDDFLRMELGAARMGVRAGGLPGILGV